uniref:Uncharacterized protein n=1 Tax=Rhizophora mucronata TaxID=61149 RepID=A0A2P2Q0X5_RHIMU
MQHTQLLCLEWHKPQCTINSFVPSRDDNQKVQAITSLTDMRLYY